MDRHSRDLWEVLRRNHIFHLLHIDIKNENSGYSPQLKKFVLIDYGLSEIVREEIGQRSSITYRGSVGFSSPEMLINCSKDIPVDLYFNDAYGTQKVIALFNEKKEKALKENYPRGSSSFAFVVDLSGYYMLYELKGRLFFRTSKLLL
jgi:serine/threonine protein kinase